MRFYRKEIQKEIEITKHHLDTVGREEDRWWEDNMAELKSELLELDKFEAYLAAWHEKQHSGDIIKHLPTNIYRKAKDGN